MSVCVPTKATNCVVEDMTLQTGGYDCNGTCINDNTGYYNWSMAWNVCKEINSCTRITRWTDGSLYYYYLRKANDIFNSNPRFLHVNFPPKCRGKDFELLIPAMKKLKMVRNFFLAIVREYS